VRAIYDDLAGCGDLCPSPRVDGAFARLVRLVVEAPAGLHARVLRHPAVRELVPRLRALCVEGEHQLEQAWAHRIATSARPRDELRRFPYVENYRMLHALEWDALARLGDGAAVERVAFVGSGPLPLTSFLLAGRAGVRVVDLDRDPHALALSRRVAEALGVADVTFRRSDVGSGAGDDELGDVDLVVLAAFVGSTPAERAVVIGHLAAVMAPGALLTVLGADGFTFHCRGLRRGTLAALVLRGLT